MVYNNYSDVVVDGKVTSSLQGNLIGEVSWNPATDTTYVSKMSGLAVLYGGAIFKSNGTTWVEVPLSGDVTVDESLSTTSTNPVQNRAIGEIVPSAASSSNQLADKAFVNSSISTATATFRGNFNVTALGLTTSATHEQVATALGTHVTTATNNDYVFVYFDLSQDPGNIDRYDRYKYGGAAWAYEFTLNNSSFTAEQWAAINSGITSMGVTNIATALSTANTAQAGLTNGSVTKVGTTTIGSATTPIYLNAGVPVAGTALAGGAYKNVDTEVTSGGTNLVTSGAVYDAIDDVLTTIFGGSY